MLSTNETLLVVGAMALALLAKTSKPIETFRDAVHAPAAYHPRPPRRMLTPQELAQFTTTRPSGEIVMAGSGGVIIDQGNQALEVSTTDIIFYAGTTVNTQVMRIKQSGRVGIGNTNPAYKLDVTGDVNFTGNMYQNGVLFQAGGSQWTTAGTAITYALGNVGIGTTNPTSTLQVAPGSTVDLAGKLSMNSTDLGVTAASAVAEAASGAVDQSAGSYLGTYYGAMTGTGPYTFTVVGTPAGGVAGFRIARGLVPGAQYILSITCSGTFPRMNIQDNAGTIWSSYDISGTSTTYTTAVGTTSTGLVYVFCQPSAGNQNLVFSAISLKRVDAAGHSVTVGGALTTRPTTASITMNTTPFNSGTVAVASGVTTVTVGPGKTWTGVYFTGLRPGATYNLSVHWKGTVAGGAKFSDNVSAEYCSAQALTSSFVAFSLTFVASSAILNLGTAGTAAAGQTIVFQNLVLQRMDATAPGFVGIGTTAPSSMLTVTSRDDPSLPTPLLDFKNTNGYGVYALSSSVASRGNTLDFMARDYCIGYNVQPRSLLSLKPDGTMDAQSQRSTWNNVSTAYDDTQWSLNYNSSLKTYANGVLSYTLAGVDTVGYLYYAGSALAFGAKYSLTITVFTNAASGTLYFGGNGSNENWYGALGNPCALTATAATYTVILAPTNSTTFFLAPVVGAGKQLYISGMTLQRMDTTVTGSMGIGTATPEHKLEVYGNAGANASVAMGARNVAPDGVTVLVLKNDQTNGGVMFFNGSTRTLDGGANTLTLRNDAGALRLQGNGGYNNAQGITIKNPGLVGINKSDPSYDLQTTNSANVVVGPMAAIAGNGISCGEIVDMVMLGSDWKYGGVFGSKTFTTNIASGAYFTVSQGVQNMTGFFNFYITCSAPAGTQMSIWTEVATAMSNQALSPTSTQYLAAVTVSVQNPRVYIGFVCPSGTVISVTSITTYATELRLGADSVARPIGAVTVGAPTMAYQGKPFIVGGTTTSFYPVLIWNQYWSANANPLMKFKLFRTSVHDDASWRGSFNFFYEGRTSYCGHGSNYYKIKHVAGPAGNTSTYRQFIAAFQQDAMCGDSFVVVWMRGGTTYYFSGENCYLWFSNRDGGSFASTSTITYAVKTALEDPFTSLDFTYDYNDGVWSKDKVLSGDIQFGTTINVKGSNVLHFGSDNNKQVDAGKIGYGTFDTSNLCIVGAGTGTRLVRMWDRLGVGCSPQMPLHVDTGSTDGYCVWFQASGIGNGKTGGTIGFGKGGSTYNQGTLVYNHSSDNSSSNSVGLGLHGADNLLRVYGTGHVVVNRKLQIGGSDWGYIGINASSWSTDWTHRFQNENTATNVYFAHAGYGMHINTGSGSGDKYIMQLLGGGVERFCVYNDGRTVVSAWLIASAGVQFNGLIAGTNMNGGKLVACNLDNTLSWGWNYTRRVLWNGSTGWGGGYGVGNAFYRHASTSGIYFSGSISNWGTGWKGIGWRVYCQSTGAYYYQYQYNAGETGGSHTPHPIDLQWNCDTIGYGTGWYDLYFWNHENCWTDGGDQVYISAHEFIGDRP